MTGRLKKIVAAVSEEESASEAAVQARLPFVSENSNGCTRSGSVPGLGSALPRWVILSIVRPCVWA
jgi:hypothetical protein